MARSTYLTKGERLSYRKSVQTVDAGVHTCATSSEPVPVAEFDLLNNIIHPGYRFVQEKFPRYLQEAQVLNDHNLL